MRKVLLAVVVAVVAAPAAALAAKPPHPAQARNGSQQAKPKVLYVLRGTLSGYTAAAGQSDGSVALTVSAANHRRAAFKGAQLSFPVSASTRVVLHEGAAVAVGDRVVVKVRYQKALDPGSSTDLAAFEATVAKQVIDRGSPTP